MIAITEALRSAALFEGITPGELSSMLCCLQAQAVEYKKGDTLLLAGDTPRQVGVVLSGRLHVIRDDIDGNRTLLATLGPADLFAEALCCAGIAQSPVSVFAETDASVLLLEFSRILHTCPSSCEFHQRLIGNMLRVVAQKNLYLQNRLELVRTKSVRAKVLGYLQSFAKQRGQSFIVPLNRGDMAEYLCVERSALSHELMRMKRDGLIEYKKNLFTLL